MKVTRRQAAAQARIANALAEAGFALPGSLTVRAYRCAKSNCRCRADPPQLHGPYALWTRKLDNKTVTRTLTDDELAAYQPLFDNAKKLRALLAELQQLTLEVVDQHAPPARSGRRNSAKQETPGKPPPASRRPGSEQSSRKCESPRSGAATRVIRCRWLRCDRSSQSRSSRIACSVSRSEVRPARPETPSLR